jgi:hypothetical protein
MNNFKLSLLVNVFLYVWICQSFIRGAIAIGANTAWEKIIPHVMVKSFIIFQFVAVIYSATCITGLLMKKNWARKMTIWGNICFAIIVAGIPISELTVFLSQGFDNYFEQFVIAKSALAIFYILLFIALTFVLRSQVALEYFSNRK